MASLPAAGADDRHLTSRRSIPIDLEVLPSASAAGRPYLPRISAVWVTFDANDRVIKTGQTVNLHLRWNIWYGPGPRVARIGWQECPAHELPRVADAMRVAARKWNAARRATLSNRQAEPTAPSTGATIACGPSSSRELLPNSERRRT